MSIRRLLKLTVFGAGVLIASPLIVAAGIEKTIFRSEAVFCFCAQLLALVPGAPGHYVRAAYYFFTLDECSWETHIGFGSLFTHRSSRIEPRFSTGNYCIFGHVAVGSGVRVASRVSVPSGKRQHLDDDGSMHEGTRYDRVTIGSGCWLGEGAIIMAPVGERSIVSAGAVVLSPVPEAVIVGGNPAKVVRQLEEHD